MKIFFVTHNTSICLRHYFVVHLSEESSQGKDGHRSPNKLIHHASPGDLVVQKVSSQTSNLWTNFVLSHSSNPSENLPQSCFVHESLVPEEISSPKLLCSTGTTNLVRVYSWMAKLLGWHLKM